MSDPRSPEEPPGFVRFTTAKSPFEARLIAALLEDAGIRSFVPGGMLTDEFAMSQRLMNVQGVEVHVPADRVEQARRVLDEVKREHGEDLDRLATSAADDPDAETPPRPQEPSQGHGKWIAAVVVLSLLALAFLERWLSTRAELQWALSSPLTEWSATDHGWRNTWRETGAIASTSVDRDFDGIPEEWTVHDRSGRLLSRSFDTDEDGVYELVRTFDRDGELLEEYRDPDQDGHFEVAHGTLADGTVVTTEDTDDDLRLDRMTVFDGDRAVLVQEFRGREGWVTVE